MEINIIAPPLYNFEVLRRKFECIWNLQYIETVVNKLQSCAGIKIKMCIFSKPNVRKGDAKNYKKTATIQSILEKMISRKNQTNTYTIGTAISVGKNILRKFDANQCLAGQKTTALNLGAYLIELTFEFWKLGPRSVWPWFTFFNRVFKTINWLVQKKIWVTQKKHANHRNPLKGGRSSQSRQEDSRLRSPNQLRMSSSWLQKNFRRKKNSW